jgi:tetrapyrrole methylase family protein / MazG family protein
MGELLEKTKKILPGISSGKKQSVNHLLNIMARLRSPEGCPWDRAQTKNTLKKYLIEETYEVLEAIEDGSPQHLKEELGDLLLQILFLCQIAEEKGQFSFFEVAHMLAEKLIRRHPHVFSSRKSRDRRIQVKNAEDVVKIWKTVKELEGKTHPASFLLDGLPLSLPALERAQRISARVSRVGFDWPNISGVWKKVLEELGELAKAGRSASTKRTEEELGDLLFTLVNWARFKGLSAEEALRKANRRFSQRFRQVELELRKKGRTPKNSSLEEMDHLWNKIKKRKQF